LMERRGAGGYHGGTALMFASVSSETIRKVLLLAETFALLARLP
jgi:hypothetical protein